MFENAICCDSRRWMLLSSCYETQNEVQHQYLVHQALSIDHSTWWLCVFPTRVSWMSELIYGKWMLWKKRSKRVLQVWSSTWLKRQLKITLVLCNNKLQTFKTFPFIHQTHPFWRNHCAIIKKIDCSLHAAKKTSKKSTDHCPWHVWTVWFPRFLDRGGTIINPLRFSELKSDARASNVTAAGPEAPEFTTWDLVDGDSAIVTLFGGDEEFTWHEIKRLLVTSK